MSVSLPPQRSDEVLRRLWTGHLPMGVTQDMLGHEEGKLPLTGWTSWGVSRPTGGFHIGASNVCNPYIGALSVASLFGGTVPLLSPNVIPYYT